METIIEAEIIEKIRLCINPQIEKSINFYIKENKSSYNSLMIRTTPTVYRAVGATDIFLAQIKTSGKIQYIAISDKYEYRLIKQRVDFTSIKSDDFVRIGINDFVTRCESNTPFSEMLQDLILKAFNYPTFGCCSRFKECSDKGYCVHDDYLYSCAACLYKRNLDVGKNFYSQQK